MVPLVTTEEKYIFKTKTDLKVVFSPNVGRIVFVRTAAASHPRGRNRQKMHDDVFT